MSPAALVIILAIGWVAITGTFTLPNALLGGAIALFVIFLLRHRMRRPLPLRRLFAAGMLVLIFLRELLLSAFGVARLVLTPRLATHLQPAIIAYPLTATTDAEIVMLANLITLTPGTLTIDVAADRRHLYIHVLALRDRQQLIDGIARGFERRVMEVFR